MFVGVWSNGAASPHSLLQQPAEYYEIANRSLPSRFPDSLSIRHYLREICDQKGISRKEIASCTAEVTEVKEISSGLLEVKWKNTNGPTF